MVAQADRLDPLSDCPPSIPDQTDETDEEQRAQNKDFDLYSKKW